MSILVQKSGFLATVQDLGRFGFRRFGINPSGAMDRQAVRLINILLGSDENEAVLEMNFPAPVLEFETDATIALGGANFGAKVSNTKIENWRPFFVKKGNILSFENRISGSRVYLAVKNGFKIKQWLGSAATNLRAEIGGFNGRTLQNGDRILFDSELQKINSEFPYKISNDLIPLYQTSPQIRVIAGAEINWLTALSELNFLKKRFIIRHESDRMGFRLRGERLYLLEKQELVSTAVDFGTIQLLPDGQMIILMADHQTSGGYPRLAHVITNDLPLLAQLNPNDGVSFQIVSHDEAENIRLQNEFELNYLKYAVASI